MAEKWYHSLFDGALKAGKVLLATATLPYYVAGEGIWARNEDNEYLEGRLFGRAKLYAPPLSTYLNLEKIPIVKSAFRYTGKKIPAYPDDHNFETPFTTGDNLEGYFKGQFTWEVVDPKKFSVNAQGDIDRVIEMVNSRVASMIGNVPEENLQAYILDYSLNLVNKGYGEYKIKDNKLKWVSTETPLNKPSSGNPIFEKYGVVVTGISPGALNFNESSEEIRRIKYKAQREAEAQEIAAKGERISREIYRKIEEEGIKSRSETADNWLQLVGMKAEDNPEAYSAIKTIIMSELFSQQMKFQRAQEAGKGGFYSEGGSSGGLGTFMTVMALNNLIKGGGLENIVSNISGRNSGSENIYGNWYANNTSTA